MWQALLPGCTVDAGQTQRTKAFLAWMLSRCMGTQQWRSPVSKTSPSHLWSITTSRHATRKTRRPFKILQRGWGLHFSCVQFHSQNLTERSPTHAFSQSYNLTCCAHPALATQVLNSSLKAAACLEEHWNAAKHYDPAPCNAVYTLEVWAFAQHSIMTVLFSEHNRHTDNLRWNLWKRGSSTPVPVTFS